ncbi:DUF4430 domain-containing protein [Bacillus tianshenii]|uniref:DUF4430 domain-containing protein n=1 Tax=Sutcliffiella tianshenii TaxID=1463404 RepID=UPI001CD3BE6D|nr:DUF4430 domain-containing protein [Bacillus tianshenii]MCA1320793.1 DUF4430 domain-containing protein [Bacillus tianshenii]
MKKFLLTLIAALTIALAGCGTEGNSTNSNSAADAPKEEQQEQLETTIKLTKDGEESISEKTVEFEEGESLMEVMERNFELTLDDSKEFIVGIDGLESDTAKSYFWTYKVNEEEIMVGAKEYMLKADDVVHFDYAKWE